MPCNKDTRSISQLTATDELTFAYELSKPDRLDKVLQKKIGSIISREKIKKLIMTGLCSVDDTIILEASKKIFFGQTIHLYLPPEQNQLIPETGEVNLVYEDSSLLIVNKTPGLTVHPAPSCPAGTLVHRLLGMYSELGNMEGERPGIVHRLDKDTSGLIVIARHEAARLALTRAYAERRVSKTYLALVAGSMSPAAGELHAPIDRHPVVKTRMAVADTGRPAHTEWTTLYADPRKNFSLVAISLHTGRTHQIRVHMAHLGYPLLGDATYAPHEVAAMAPRQMLHAWKLAFEHPVTSLSCSFVAPMPEDMLHTMLGLSRRMQRVIITGLPGCGKSLLAHMLKERNCHVWSADDAIREMYRAGGEGWQILHHRFRGTWTNKEGVDKAALAEAMRATPGLREEIEMLIHPLVYEKLEQFWNHAEADGQLAAFAEIPLWPETQSRTRGESSPDPYFVIGVRCPASIRHERLAKRGWSPEMIAAADSWQYPEDKKLSGCDVIVENSSGIDALERQTQDILNTLEQRRLERTRRLEAVWNAALKK